MHAANDLSRLHTRLRRTYSVGGMVGICLVLYDIWLISQGVYGPIWGTTIVFLVNDLLLIGFTIYTIVCLIRDQTHEGLVQIERRVFYFLAFEHLLMNHLVPMIVRRPLEQIVAGVSRDDIWFMIMVCTLALHVFSGRGGVVRAVAIFAASLAMVSVELRSYGIALGTASWFEVAQIYAAAALVLSFFQLLALYRNHTDQLETQINLLAELAYIDQLTGLRNRTSLFQLLEAQHAHEAASDSWAICLIDLDRFKQINDSFGHSAGDAALRRAGEQLQSVLNTGQIVGRWGGEEFLVLLPNSGQDEAVQIAEAMRKALHRTPGQRLTASFGVASNIAGEGLEALIVRADQALYQAKAQGRDRVVVGAPLAHYA